MGQNSNHTSQENKDIVSTLQELEDTIPLPSEIEDADIESATGGVAQLAVMGRGYWPSESNYKGPKMKRDVNKSNSISPLR
jgi:hypothetical protein